MKSHTIALAALAAVGFVGGAYAEDAKPKLTAPTVMSDSEMDKVTAGAVACQNFSNCAAVDGPGPGVNVTLSPTADRHAESLITPPTPAGDNPAERDLP